MQTLTDLYNYVMANGMAIAGIVTAAYALIGAVAHFTKTTVDDRIVDFLTKPVSLVLSFLTKGNSPPPPAPPAA